MPSQRSSDILRAGLREQVYDAVLRMLLEGEIAPGDRLSIDSVARQLDVSPTPVREAFVMLERTGLVTRVALKGYRVAPPLDAEQVEELLGVRRLLEAEAVRLACQHRDALLPELRRLMAAHVEHAAAVQEAAPEVSTALIQDYFHSDADFHAAIFAHTGNRYLEQMYSSLGAITHRMRQAVVRGPRDVVEATREHRAILDAVERGDVAAAVDAMTTHLANVRERSLADLDG